MTDPVLSFWEKQAEDFGTSDLATSAVLTSGAQRWMKRVTRIFPLSFWMIKKPAPSVEYSTSVAHPLPDVQTGQTNE